MRPGDCFLRLGVLDDPGFGVKKRAPLTGAQLCCTVSFAENKAMMRHSVIKSKSLSAPVAEGQPRLCPGDSRAERDSCLGTRPNGTPQGATSVVGRVAALGTTNQRIQAGNSREDGANPASGGFSRWDHYQVSNPTLPNRS